MYEEAATRPERTNLENVRRGQYEALKQEMGVKPERDPDFGPNQVGPAGATVIGARQPLIAYNVYLTTDDISIAEKIARTIRFSSGGLAFCESVGHAGGRTGSDFDESDQLSTRPRWHWWWKRSAVKLLATG